MKDSNGETKSGQDIDMSLLTTHELSYGNLLDVLKTTNDGQLAVIVPDSNGETKSGQCMSMSPLTSHEANSVVSIVGEYNNNSFSDVLTNYTQDAC